MTLKNGIIALASIISPAWIWRVIALKDGIISTKEGIVLFAVYLIVFSAIFLKLKDLL